MHACCSLHSCHSLWWPYPCLKTVVHADAQHEARQCRAESRAEARDSASAGGCSISRNSLWVSFTFDCPAHCASHHIHIYTCMIVCSCVEASVAVSAYIQCIIVCAILPSRIPLFIRSFMHLFTRPPLGSGSFNHSARMPLVNVCSSCATCCVEISIPQHATKFFVSPPGSGLIIDLQVVHTKQ